MSDLIVVAIPSDDDYVWRLSSEKIPHMTLCYLGDQEVGPERQRMVDFVEHASKTMLHRFGLTVDRRGKLGDKNADVLFFDDDYCLKLLKDFRSSLLANKEIFDAYNSVEQYPEWVAHLTMGFPESPAKIDTRDYPGISWVNFDRIALWDGDYEGPTIELDPHKFYEVMSMSETDEDALIHFGVKGMKWGVTSKKSGSAKSDQKATKQIAKADKKWEKKAGRSAFEVHNAASKRMNKTEIDRINNKPAYKDKDFTEDSPLRRKYYKEYSDTFMKVMNEESQRINGTNPSGTKRLKFTEDENGDIHYDWEDVKHDDESFRSKSSTIP